MADGNTSITAARAIQETLNTLVGTEVTVKLNVFSNKVRVVYLRFDGVLADDTGAVIGAYSVAGDDASQSIGFHFNMVRAVLDGVIFLEMDMG